MSTSVLFIKQPHSLWIEAVGQSVGPGPYGPVPSLGGTQLEQVLCRVVLIMQDFVHLPKAACGVDGADLQKASPNDFPPPTAVPAVQP